MLKMGFGGNGLVVSVIIFYSTDLGLSAAEIYRFYLGKETIFKNLIHFPGQKHILKIR